MHALCLHIRRLKTWFHAKLVLRRLVGLVVLITLWLFSTQRVPAQMLTGSYTGDANDDRQIGQLGFQPSFVIIKSGSSLVAVGRTSSMSGSKPLVGAEALSENLIQSLDSSGFTIGDDARVNQVDEEFYWAAFKTADGDTSVGSYLGNGTGQSITGMGFKPCYLIVMSEGIYSAVHTSTNIEGFTRRLDTVGGSSNGVTSLDTGGFTVGTDDTVNKNGITYHYVAWKQSDTKVKVGSYTGNNTDGTSISVGTNFYPEYVIVQATTATYGAVHHPGSLGYYADSTLPFDTGVVSQDRIQALGTSDFQIGTAGSVNKKYTYFWVAFARQAPPTAVELISFTASQYERRVLLQWETGFEVDNLGFHVYRQSNGERVRITPQLIAGSALLAGAGTPLTAGRSYTWADFVGEAAGAVQYWLEDIDLNGRRTLHGPVAPVLSSEPLPEQEVSALLSQRARSHAQKSETFVRAQDLRAKLRGRPAPQVSRQAKTLVPAQGPLLAEGEPTPGQIAAQWAIAAGPAVKIAVREKGWHRVRQPELLAAGLDPTVNPRLLQLYADGIEQAIVVTGESDGWLHPTDTVEFYGTGLDTLSTDKQTYWLVAGSRPGKRIAEAPGHGSNAGSPQAFLRTAERKERTFYFAGLRNGEASNFFGSFVTVEPVDQVVAACHLAPSPPGNATLEVASQGGTAGAHRVAIQLNGVEVGTAEFDGQSHGSVSIAVPQSALLEGDNLVTLVALGGETDVSLVDAVRLIYWHSYTADQDALECTATGGTPLTIRGFGNPAIRVMDVTDPAAPVGLRTLVKREAGGYNVRVRAPNMGRRTLLAFTPDRIKTATQVVANAPSKWHDSAGAADIAMIAHGTFVESLQALKALREGQGWSVALINVEDLYDEFNFGAKSPSAVRDFLAWAQNAWQKPPRFVILAGDASFDPRNYLGLGDYDFVPTKEVETAYLETASDDWFVDFNGDGLPEMAVGRLPVRTADEAAAVVGKIVGYEQAPAGDWTKKVLLVAGKKDAFDFATASAEVAVLLPTDMTLQAVMLGWVDPVLAKAMLLGYWNEGPLLVNYLGHGSVDLWAPERVLTSRVAGTLTNAPRLPFVVSMTCLNGLFDDLYLVSLGEALLLNPNGGAVAVWASSGLTELGGQTVMDKELVKLLFGGQSLTIGEAAAKAKAAVRDMDIRRTWVLLGDPAMKLK